LFCIYGAIIFYLFLHLCRNIKFLCYFHFVTN
jgi:hypothetical protein